MIQMELLLLFSHPHPQLHPPPQFVADKSLMINPPKNLFLQCILCTTACLISSNYEKFHGFSS